MRGELGFGVGRHTLSLVVPCVLWADKSDGATPVFPMPRCGKRVTSRSRASTIYSMEGLVFLQECVSWLTVPSCHGNCVRRDTMRDAPGCAESPGATKPPDEAPVFADVTRKRGGARSSLRSAPRLYVVLAAGRRLRRRLCRSAPRYSAAVVSILSTSTITSCMRHGDTAVRA